MNRGAVDELACVARDLGVRLAPLAIAWVLRDAVKRVAGQTEDLPVPTWK